MSREGPVACAECGLALGTGLPGAMKHCVKCGGWVATEARHDPSDAAGALLVLAGAFVVGALVVAVVAAIFGGD